MKTKMRFSLLVVLLLLAAGIVVIAYPFASNWINQKNQADIMDYYEDAIGALTKEQIAAEKEAARAYNESLLGNVLLTDPFEAEAHKNASEEYEQRLNLSGDGVMGYIEIPNINVKLVIYHGTDSETLEKGVGHMENTSLPIGGEATHAVLSAHTAYAKATLFNDLINLQKGDTFYLKVLDEILAYQVDQIKVVEPSDTSDLLIDRNADQVTLVTCTPYGVNSHRLLVRGTRIPYVEEEAAGIQAETGQPYPYVILLIILFVLLLVTSIIVTKKRRRRRKEVNNEKEK